MRKLLSLKKILLTSAAFIGAIGLAYGQQVVQLISSQVNVNGQAAMSASAPVVLANNQAMADPCIFQAKTSVAITQTASTTIITGTSAKKTYVCSFAVVAAAAEVINITAGTGTVCATGPSVVMGSSTAGNGLSLAANGGITFGAGVGTVMSSSTAADNMCLTQNGSNRVSGVITYVQQ